MMADLDNIDHTLKAATLEQRARYHWSRRSAKPERRLEVARVLLNVLRREVAVIVFPRLCLIGFTFAQPFLISRIISWISQPNSSLVQNEGYSLIAATFLIYAESPTLHYQHNLYRLVTAFRAAALTIIYEHLLSTETVPNDSPAVTLMATDIDRISSSLENLHEVWALAIEVIIGTYLLGRQLGWVCVAPLIVVVLSTIGSGKVTRLIGDRRKMWADAVQRRIGTTTRVLASMKSVKLMGLTEVMAGTFQNQRVGETQKQAGYRWIIVWMNVFSNIPWALAPVATFIIFTLQTQGNQSLTTTTDFTSLSIITLLTSPAAKLLAAVPSTAASRGCFDRIQEFLVSSTMQDPREHFSSREKRAPVEVEKVTAGPAPGAAPVLINASVKFEDSGLSLVIGKTGVGKSTFLRLLLGEIKCETGRVMLSDLEIQTAYCSQEPWLPNASIYQIICTAESAKDPDWYRSVLNACLLDEDLVRLRHGDQTVVGSGGVKLSGGQKQRIALARAIYSRPKLLLLDDSFSAQDLSTIATIVARLFGNSGLLQQLGCTTFLVSHSSFVLKVARKVFQLGGSGKSRQVPVDPQILQDMMNEEHVVAPSQEAEAQTTATTLTTESLGSKEKVEPYTQVGERATCRYYLKHIGIGKLLIFVLFCAINSFCSSFSQIWLEWWADDDSQRNGFYTGIYALLAVGNILSMGGYVGKQMMVKIAPATARTLHQVLLDATISARFSTFVDIDTGSILNRFSQDMTLVEGSLPIGLLVTISNFFSLSAQLGLIASGSLYMAATIPFMLAALYILQHVYLQTSRPLRLLDLDAKGPIFSHFTTTANGLVTIRAFGWQEDAAKKSIRLVVESQKPYYLMFCAQRWLNLILDSNVMVLATILVALVVNLRASTGAGRLGVSLNNVLNFNLTIRSVVNGYTMVETSLGSIAGVMSFAESTRSEPKPRLYVVPPPEWPARGDIQVTSLTTLHSNDQPAVRDLSLEIKAGERIAICGRTASGKTSVIMGMMQLNETSHVSIVIDSIDLADLPRDLVRQRIKCIPQDSLVLSGSVRFNLIPTMPPIHQDEQLIEALEQIHLWDTINHHGGLATELSDYSLSHGQQQLFALARAMLSDCCILILDEATSDMVLETDRIAQAAIRKYFHGRTTITVAHRLETIMDSDKIAVMESSRLVEYGRPKNLSSDLASALSRLLAHGEQRPAQGSAAEK
ncbi:putative ATP-binding cassette transporter [Calycina marina]|uniref:ATP-binding cassette transporter n=1 Tax=Calycina marina TaxID=1763456 RepID=A0A9P7Z1Y6_9HELO|nr:putative ATP-binding cassette transporter [Calycina marina]